jgi:pilus assembly protein CpaC
MVNHALRQRSLRWLLVGSAWWLWACGLAAAQDNPSANPSIIHKVRTGEKLEMVVNTSQILTLGLQIPQVLVQNPDLLTATPLSPTQVQVVARKTGVTQINLWDEKNQVHTIDVLIVGDARELTMLLTTEFPGASIKVRPVGNGALISGYVDRPEDLERIRALAEEYYPKVIMNITVGGVQQVLLHIKVMEVSRSKLRTLGFDWAQISNGNIDTLVRSGVSGLIGVAGSQGVPTGTLPISPNSTFQFGIVDGSNVFFGVLEALCQSDVARIVSEPRVVAVSGRPSYFNVGGEIPYTVSQGLGAVEIEWKKFGTRVDFVPIVLGNGRVRLELRPRVSEIDRSHAAVEGVPAIKESVVDTAVELGAGQTLAIAGLVQTRTEAQTRGLPWVSDVPYVGALFRRVHEEKNEIETLILVTPEFADAMDPHEVPQCGPGMRTASPSDWELYMEGHVEVPNRCPPCTGGGCPKQGGPWGQGAAAGPPKREDMPGFGGPIGYEATQ